MRLFDINKRFGVIHNLKEKTLYILSFPWNMFKKHLIDNDSHRPDITLVSIVIF
jgi:hypothetical protein